MIATIPEFEAETAFERLALDRYLPLTAQESGSYIDIRPLIDGEERVVQNGAGDVQASREVSLRASFLPLAFGAAWKVIDLTLELALAMQGKTPQQKDQFWAINKKVRFAESGIIDGALLTNETHTWQGVVACYVSTVDYRHSLVHRKAQFAETPLTLSGQRKDGSALPLLDETTLRDFITVSQLVGEGVIHNGLNARRLDNLNFYLNRLSDLGVHSVPTGTQMRPIEYYWMKLQQDQHGQWVAPFTIIREQMRRRGQLSHFDVRIDLPHESGRQLVGQCEELPDEDVIIDLKHPPHYLAYR